MMPEKSRVTRTCLNAAILLWSALLLFALAGCADGPQGEAVATTSQIGALPTVEPTEEELGVATPAATETPQPYGAPQLTPTARPSDYPPPVTPSATATLGAYPQDADETAYLPFSTGGSSTNDADNVTALATEPSPDVTSAAEDTPTPIVPTPTPEPIPTLDVLARQTALEGSDRQLAFSKIGFHVTFLEEKGILDQWMQELDAAAIPFYLKTVDNAEPLYKAQLLMKESGVQHTLVFRATGGVPDYSLPPSEAARQHWDFHREKFPPELDPELVWVETINEVDKNRSEWLAEFALETARLMMADGFRWAAFSWAPGEPEPENWQGPAMLEFLRLAGENPDRLAIAVHEGSLSAEDIRALYPYRLGRFMNLFEICDENGIPRPTVLITEWGWEYNNIPPVEQAMADIAWAANLYAHFPEVKGAAIWNLGTGCCFGTVSEQVRELIDPLRRFNLTASYEIPRPPLRASTDPDSYN